MMTGSLVLTLTAGTSGSRLIQRPLYVPPLVIVIGESTDRSPTPIATPAAASLFCQMLHSAAVIAGVISSSGQETLLLQSAASGVQESFRSYCIIQPIKLSCPLLLAKPTSAF